MGPCGNVYYGVATISRLLKMIGLFCKRALLKRLHSAKETYHFKEPTNRSHPVATLARHYKILKSQLDGHFIYGIWKWAHFCFIKFSKVSLMVILYMEFVSELTFALSNSQKSAWCSLLKQWFMGNESCVAVCCSDLQCVAVCCSVLQCVPVCSSVFQLGDGSWVMSWLVKMSYKMVVGKWFMSKSMACNNELTFANVLQDGSWANGSRSTELTLVNVLQDGSWANLWNWVMSWLLREKKRFTSHPCLSSTWSYSLSLRWWSVLPVCDVYACLCVCLGVCVWMCFCMCRWICVCGCMYACVYKCMDVYVSVWIYK